MTQNTNPAMYVVVFRTSDVQEAHGPFMNLGAARTWASVNGGRIYPLRPASPIPNRVKIALTQIRVAA